jgi:glycosyltransferase involved in cell wall biosynthesis
MSSASASFNQLLSSLRPQQTSILLVGNFLSQSIGNRSVCEDLAEHLHAQGWRVSTTSTVPGKLRRLTDMLSTAWRMRHDYGMAQVDVYSGPAFFWAVCVCVLLKALNKPYVLTLHGGNLPDFSQRWYFAVERLLRSATAVTTPSGYLFEAMRGFRSDIQILPNAIALPQYPFVARSQVRPKLVWIRAFHRIYEPQLAVRVLALLAPRFPDIELTMVGPDKGDGSLQQTQALAAQLGVSQRIRFPGRVPKEQIAQWVNAGDIFVNTSTVDNTPVTVIEAMACGACVASTKVGGIPHICSHGVDAMLSPAGDAGTMAANITAILDQPRLAETLSMNARGRVELLDWDAILPRWNSLLRRIATHA